MDGTLEDDVYHTLGKPGRFDLVVKGSRFIGHAASSVSREVADRLVESVAEQYRDATHCCYAYRIGIGDRSTFRANDAGEPSGTAGRPILDAIDRRKLADVVCVVARYFGGIKLGTGGLARAYGECAGRAIDAGETVEQFLMETIHLEFGCEWTGKVMRTISRHRCRVEKGEFQEHTRMDVLVRRSKSAVFRRDLMDATSGKAVVSPSLR
jgi:uncharacterized YigZ family protein